MAVKRKPRTLLCVVVVVEALPENIWGANCKVQSVAAVDSSTKKASAGAIVLAAPHVINSPSAFTAVLIVLPSYVLTVFTAGLAAKKADTSR